MDKRWFDTFSDREYWEDLAQTYIKTGKAAGKTPFSHVTDLWDYFKFCILTDNRYFLNHPLLDVVKAKVGEHVITLPANTTLFRARVDTENTLRDKAHNLMQANILHELRAKKSILGKAEVDKLIQQCIKIDGYDAYREQHQSGFEGFTAEESMCPPPHKVSHGRCNLPHSQHLYAAADIHTAAGKQGEGGI